MRQHELVSFAQSCFANRVALQHLKIVSTLHIRGARFAEHTHTILNTFILKARTVAAFPNARSRTAAAAAAAAVAEHELVEAEHVEGVNVNHNVCDGNIVWGSHHKIASATCTPHDGGTAVYADRKRASAAAGTVRAVNAEANPKQTLMLQKVKTDLRCDMPRHRKVLRSRI
jgi:hypothetical protein